MLYLVVYDIAHDQIRARLADVVAAYGRRVQESVFECELDPEALAELTERLKKVLQRPEHGQVRLYRVCDRCRSASFGLGQIKTVDADSYYII